MVGLQQQKQEQQLMKLGRRLEELWLGQVLLGQRLLLQLMLPISWQGEWGALALQMGQA